MKYQEFVALYGESKGDPLIAWVDDSRTTDEDFFEYLGPIPTAAEWARIDAEGGTHGEKPPRSTY